VLLDFANEEGTVGTENMIKDELRKAVEEVIKRSRLFDKEWDAFDPYLYRVTYFFVKKCFNKDDALRETARRFKDRVKLNSGWTWPKSPGEVLPMVTEVDEKVFFRKYKERSTATDTDKYRENEHIGRR